MNIPLFLQVVATPIENQPLSTPVIVLFVLVALSLAPFLVMMTTSFVKLSVVFSLIRSALGTQQIPPNAVITGLAIILTVYIMYPVGQDVYSKAQTVIETPGSQSESLLSMASFDRMKQAVELGKEPVRDFLMKHSSNRERSLFYNLAKSLRRGTTDLTDQDFLVIIPAFMISELSEAFQIGFIIFLPFLVIDIVVSNILLSMGMFMVSPITISFPFKLLLFVLVDGWYLITKGLIQGYT